MIIIAALIISCPIWLIALTLKDIYKKML